MGESGSEPIYREVPVIANDLMPDALIQEMEATMLPNICAKWSPMLHLAPYDLSLWLALRTYPRRVLGRLNTKFIREVVPTLSQDRRKILQQLQEEQYMQRSEKQFDELLGAYALLQVLQRMSNRGAKEIIPELDTCMTVQTQNVFRRHRYLTQQLNEAEAGKYPTGVPEGKRARFLAYATKCRGIHQDYISRAKHDSNAHYVTLMSAMLVKLFELFSEYSDLAACFEAREVQLN